MVRGLALALALVATSAFVPATTPAARQLVVQQNSLDPFALGSGFGADGGSAPKPAPFKPRREMDSGSTQTRDARDDYLSSAVPQGRDDRQERGREREPYVPDRERRAREQQGGRMQEQREPYVPDRERRAREQGGRMQEQREPYVPLREQRAQQGMGTPTSGYDATRPQAASGTSYTRGGPSSSGTSYTRGGPSTSGYDATRPQAASGTSHTRGGPSSSYTAPPPASYSPTRSASSSYASPSPNFFAAPGREEGRTFADSILDPESADRMRQINFDKEAAVAREDFDEAKRLKRAEDALVKYSGRLAQLAISKRDAVDVEDYERAQFIKAEVDKIWYQIEEQSRIDYVAREERERMMPQGRSTFGQPTGNDWSGTGTQRERRDRPFERKKARGSPSRAIEFASRFFG